MSDRPIRPRRVHGRGARQGTTLGRWLAFALPLLCCLGLSWRPANAGAVYVQAPGVLTGGPVFADEPGNILDPFGPNWTASADIRSGTFRAYAYINSTNNSISVSPFARAGISAPYSFTNVGSVPTTFPAGSLMLNVSAGYLNFAGPIGVNDNRFRNRVQASLFLTAPDGSQAYAGVSHDLVWDQASNSYLTDAFTPSSYGGGLPILIGADQYGMAATLAMPAFTVDPGQTWSFSAVLEIYATAAGTGAEVHTDAYYDPLHDAQLSLTLPAGVALSDYQFNSTVPIADLTWVTPLPEPSSLALLSSGAGLLYALRRRRSRRAGR